MQLVYFNHLSYTAIDNQGNVVQWADIPLDKREAALKLPSPPPKPTRVAW